jgi:carboxylesterase type B
LPRITGLFVLVVLGFTHSGNVNRLGAFGWLSPPGQDITPNAGFFDAQAAMLWVNNYISAFGGDHNRVTVMGESAGAGIIMHAITAYGGTESPPLFQQVYICNMA